MKITKDCINFWKSTGLQPKILREIAKESKEILDLCGDPEIEGEWLRKALYSGMYRVEDNQLFKLIALGIDAGYKIFIVLAGTTNSLRMQTQERMEENVIGQISERPGLYADKKIKRLKALHSMTRELDFNKTRDQVINFDHEVGTIFIIKKNVSVLKSLLSEFDRIRGESKIDVPLLLIDDEADNATVNTASKKNVSKNLRL